MTIATDNAPPAGEAQSIEAEASRLATIEAGAAVDSPNPADGGAPAPVSGSPPAEAPPAPLQRVTAGDTRRAEIAARFKQSRGSGIDFHGDMRDPSMRYGQYGAPSIEGRDTAPADGPEPGIPADQIIPPAPAAAQPEPAPEPAAHAQPQGLTRVVVHGTEMWLTPEQVIAEAQKSLAAGNILDTAKQIKDAVARSTAGVPSAHVRAGVGPSRPDPAGDDAQSNASREPGAPNQDDPYGQIVHDIQYGEDPNAASQRLRQTVAADARAAAQEALVRERFGSERSHRIRALAAFQAANTDLAADPYAPTVITQEVNRQYVADLKAIGVPDDQMPRTAAEIADWHMQARVQGKPVRDIGEIFETAKTRFVQWRGGPRPNPAPVPAEHQQPAQRPTAPRVELSPDRTQRRANVPVQPTRASAPIAQPAAPPPGGDRSAAVMAMRRARGQVVG